MRKTEETTNQTNERIADAVASLALFTTKELAKRANATLATTRKAIRAMIDGGTVQEYGRVDGGYKLFALSMLF